MLELWTEIYVQIEFRLRVGSDTVLRRSGETAKRQRPAEEDEFEAFNLQNVYAIYFHSNTELT